MIVANTLAAAGFAWGGTVVLVRAGKWLVHQTHNPKLALVSLVVVLWIQAAVAVGVWMWALF